MKGNQKKIFPLIMVLQIFIISFAVMAIPAAAVPDSPTAIIGSVELDGKLAPVGTEISVELNGNELANEKVKTEGQNDGLYLSILSENYPNLKFYVNGNEAKLVDATVLENVDVEAAVLEGVDITATSPVTNNVNYGGSSSSGGGGGSGGYISTATNDSEEVPSGSTVITSTTDVDDTSLRSVATDQPMESSEEVPASETGSSMMIVVIGAIILMGIVVTVRYKLKEN